MESIDTCRTSVFIEFETCRVKSTIISMHGALPSTNKENCQNIQNKYIDKKIIYEEKIDWKKSRYNNTNIGIENC